MVVLGFALSFLGTIPARRLAVRFNILDVPAGYKAHSKPIPLLGGSAIFLAILTPSLLIFSIASIWSVKGIPQWVPDQLAIHVAGAASKALMGIGILTAAMILHVVGIIDDARDLSPLLKLFAQVVVSLGVVLVCRVRILTMLGTPLSVTVSVIWLVAITNAFNFLDNMDGLAAGVAAICAAALLGASIATRQVFIAGWSSLILGASLGFLPHNFPPAKTFMGDGGSLVIGFLLAVVSSLTTYVRPAADYSLYGVFVPLVLMGVPLYDMVSVITLRIRRRRNPMVGDRRHFSHRLVRRGMPVRTAVLTIYLCTAATAIAASLLGQVKGNTGAVLVFVQMLAILGIVAVLESSDGKP